MSSSSSRIHRRHRAQLGCWMLIAIPRETDRKLWAKGEFPQRKQKKSPNISLSIFHPTCERVHLSSNLPQNIAVYKALILHQSTASLASTEFDCWLIWTGQYGRDRRRSRYEDVLARGQAVFDDVTRRRAVIEVTPLRVCCEYERDVWLANKCKWFFLMWGVTFLEVNRLMGRILAEWRNCCYFNWN